MEKEEFNCLFGEFVKFKREQNKWTQPDLAERMGNNFQNISRIERGEVNPTLYWTKQLATAFDTKLSMFLSEFEEFSNFNLMKKSKKKSDRAKTMEELMKESKNRLDKIEKFVKTLPKKKDFDKNLEKATQKADSKNNQKQES